MGHKKNKKENAQRAAKYKRAFDEVIGDPFAYGEPIEGHYITLKNSSKVKVAGTNIPESPSPPNRAKPNFIDFFCDVESAVEDGLEAYSITEAPRLWTIFIDTYITQIGEYTFNQKERAEVEQYIGRIFVSRGISPVQKYFTTIKQ
jgi:hypothetical protein